MPKKISNPRKFILVGFSMVLMEKNKYANTRYQRKYQVYSALLFDHNNRRHVAAGGRRCRIHRTFMSSDRHREPKFMNICFCNDPHQLNKSLLPPKLLIKNNYQNITLRNVLEIMNRGNKQISEYS